MPIRMLNVIEKLKSSGYGRPWPRHGLQLLYWFCNDYVKRNLNGDLMASEDPKGKKYGFHCFENRLEDDRPNSQLLPNQDCPYYEVGNLNAEQADDLPSYVKVNSKSDNNFSNIDRIIISLNPDLMVDKVYVTQHHKDNNSFHPQHTFCISKRLILDIGKQSLEKLLSQVEYIPEPSAPIIHNVQERPAFSPVPDGVSIISIPEYIYFQPERRWCIIL